jgi:hypothetical protein
MKNKTNIYLVLLTNIIKIIFIISLKNHLVFPSKKEKNKKQKIIVLTQLKNIYPKTKQMIQYYISISLSTLLSIIYIPIIIHIM